MARLIRFAAVILLLSVTGQAQAMRLKVATLSPEGSVWMQKMREGASELAQKTANRVQIKFYPGGVMGDDKAVLRKIRIGQLHGGAVVGGSLSQFYPDNQIYSLPLKFKSFEEVQRAISEVQHFVGRRISFVGCCGGGGGGSLCFRC